MRIRMPSVKWRPENAPAGAQFPTLPGPWLYWGSYRALFREPQVVCDQRVFSPVGNPYLARLYAGLFFD
jgi:hypothetical protein